MDIMCSRECNSPLLNSKLEKGYVISPTLYPEP